MSNSSKGNGLTFWGGLQLLFIGLKLANVLDWSWWLVLWPFWVDLAILAVGLLLILLSD